jgi:hypothetical protein
MKTNIFFVAGIAMCILASCDNAVETPLVGNLVKTEKQDSKTEKTILGVKDKETGKVVVKPAAYTDITADENLIICTGKEGIRVFLPDGTSTGSTLATFQKEAKGYYTGTITGDERTQYYMPTTKKWLSISATFKTADLLILQADTQWLVVKSNGEQLWKFPLAATLLEKEAGSKYEVAITPEPTKKVKKPATTVYSITGDSITTYPADKWAKEVKPAQQEQVAASTVLKFGKSQTITPVKNIP